MRIVRACWTDSNLIFHWDHVPTTPQHNEVVYVWGVENEQRLRDMGYDTRLVENSVFNEEYAYGRKLEALDRGLKEFGEVLLLDWDCVFVKPIDTRFYELLQEKPIQVPIYVHPIDNPFGNSWKVEEGVYFSPNFGFCYSRDRNLGSTLIDIAKANDIPGCVEEWSLSFLVNCTLEEYVKNYLPKIGHGVGQEAVPIDHENYSLQKKAWDYVEEKHQMEIYLKHL
jgi:hypothetical protein